MFINYKKYFFFIIVVNIESQHSQTLTMDFSRHVELLILYFMESMVEFSK